MQTILRLAAFMVASALFAADGEPEPEAESDERSAAALFATHRGYCVSYTEVGNWRRDDARTVYLSGVFHVDVDDWRNVKEDRPSTSREVAMHFELDYAAWLQPRYRGVGAHKTHCWLFAADADVDARREKDLDDFRELGHRVVETDWLPEESL